MISKWCLVIVKTTIQNNNNTYRKKNSDASKSAYGQLEMCQSK